MDQVEGLRSALADRYRIEREIGSGGMATVYLAEDLKHHRKVAVKVLDPELAQNLGAERFLREIKTAANLSHPHILPIHDSGEADGFLYYVMPYAKGESLRSRLTKEKQLPVEDAIQITREIADALAYAHREGVIHRDVKPANIMLDEGHAVLADFGIAQAVGEAKDQRLTRTGTSLGTPAYMSPEQASGEQDLDGRSDQYALGCVLYEMLAGHPPFTGAQVEAVIRQHLMEEPPLVTRVRPSVTEDVVKVINRALSKSPADRFKTTGEMAAALALTTSPVQKASGPFSKPVGIALMAGALLVVAGVALWGMRGGEELSEPTWAAPPAAAEDSRPAIAVLPLDNFSPDPNDAYFADGVHEEIISKLSKISALRVISRNSVMGYREERKPTRQVAAELGVGFILEGSARIAGGMVRLTLQLIDGNTDTHLWSEDYDRPYTVEDFISTQSEIAREIATALRVEITPEEDSRISSLPTKNLDAYEFYLLGRHRFYTRSAENLRDAIRYFGDAIEQDSTFALAWAGLADAWNALPWYEPVPSQEAYAKGRDAAQRAVDLDEDLAEAHTALGGLALWHEWAWESAETHLLRAVELNPNHAQAHHWLGIAHYALGRPDRAIQSMQEGVRLSPLGNSFRYTLANLLYHAGRVEEALVVYREAEKLQPPVGFGLQFMSVAFLQQGQAEEAFRVIRRWGEVVGYPNPERLPVVLRAFEASEFTGEALAVLEDVRRTTGLRAGDLPGLYLNLDAPAEALRIVQEMIAQRNVFVPVLGMTFTRAKLLEHPEIVAALQAVGVPGF